MNTPKPYLCTCSYGTYEELILRSSVELFFHMFARVELICIRNWWIDKKKIVEGKCIWMQIKKSILLDLDKMMLAFFSAENIYREVNI